MTNNRTEPEQWAVDVEYLAKLADWAAGQGFCQIEGLPDPDEWCYDKWNEMFPKSCGDDYSAQALADGLIASIQRAFEDRERKLRDENKLLREALDADCTAFAAMEAKLIEVAGRISGSNGGPPCHPDPVLLSEWVSEINHAALKEAPDAQ